MVLNKFKATGIPFGISAADGAEVDICDVERGLACGCICPSCKAPLIARKGDINEWHFAHASKDGHKRDITDCKISFFVSARMMAKKILSTATSINLPAGFAKASLSGRYLGVDYGDSVKFTEQSCFIPEKTVVGTNWNGMAADALMEKNGYQLALFFSCPDKKSNFLSSVELSEKSGVLEINLSDLPEWFYGQDRQEGVSYVEILKRYILDSIDNKIWLYHPKMKEAKSEADRLLKRRLSNNPLDYRNANKQLINDRINNLDFPKKNESFFNFSCAKCRDNWKESYQDGWFCHRCQTHLHVAYNGPVK